MGYKPSGGEPGKRRKALETYEEPSLSVQIFAVVNRENAERHWRLHVSWLWKLGKL